MSGEEIRFNFAKYDVGGKGAKAGKENQEPSRLNTQQSLFKVPPVKMPNIPDKSNDSVFDKTHQVDNSNDSAFDKSNPISNRQLNEQLSKINVKNLMEKF